MNYYERYSGDYMRDTAHLSLTDHGVYTVLLDIQYAMERGLPAGYDDLFRICRAMSKLEQVCVRDVADEFFPIAEDGLRWNPRARREIAEAQRRIAASRTNGRGGGRPRKETHEKPSGFPKRNLDETQRQPDSNPPETHAGEAFPHTPNPKPQEGQKRGSRAKRAPRSLETPLPEGFAISDRVRRWAAEKGHGRLAERFEHFVGKARAKGYVYADWDEAFMGAIRDDWAGLNGKNGTGRTAHDERAQRRADTLSGLTGGMFDQRRGRVIDVDG